MTKSFFNGCIDALAEIRAFAFSSLHNYDACIAVGSSGFYLGAMTRMIDPAAHVYFAPLSGNIFSPKAIQLKTNPPVLNFEVNPDAFCDETAFRESLEAYRTFLETDRNAIDFTVEKGKASFTHCPQWIDFGAIEAVLRNNGKVALIDVSETASGLISATYIFRALFPDNCQNITPFIFAANGFPHSYEDINGQLQFGRPLTNKNFHRLQKEYELGGMEGEIMLLTADRFSTPCHVITTDNMKLLLDLTGGCENGLRALPRYVFSSHNGNCGCDLESVRKVEKNKPNILQALNALYTVTHPEQQTIYSRSRGLSALQLGPSLAG